MYRTIIQQNYNKNMSVFGKRQNGPIGPESHKNRPARVKEEIKIGLNIYCMLGINLLNLVILATPHSPLLLVTCSEMRSRKKKLSPDFLNLYDHCEKNIKRIFYAHERREAPRCKL